VKEGVEKFSRYFRRKGWFGEQSAQDQDALIGNAQDEGMKRDAGTWHFSEGGLRIVLEVATAWAVTKALSPARLVLSVWATPWFARICVLPVTRWTSKIFGRGGNTAPRAAGTSNAGASVVPKTVESAARKT
jgi:hypothetical protein